MQANLVSAGNFPDADLVVGVTGVEGGAISRPGKGDALGLVSALGGLELGLEVVDDGLGVQVPDLDGGAGGSAEPVAVGAEDEGVDDVAGLQGVEVLGGVEVPEHDGVVLTTGSAEGTIGGDGNSVDITSMTNVVNGKLRGGSLKVPNLDELVPTGRDDHGVGRVGGEADSRDPLGVASSGGVTARSGSELTLEVTTGVPDLDGLVARTRDDQAVVRGEGNGHDVVVVTNEAGLSLAVLQVPETHGLVPGGSQGETTVSRQGDVLDEVVVTVEGALGNTIVLLGAGQLPNNGSLVYTEESLIHCSNQNIREGEEDLASGHIKGSSGPTSISTWA